MPQIRSLYALLGFRIDGAGAQKFNGILRTLRFDLIAITALWAGASASLGLFLREAGKMEQINVAFNTMLGSVQMSKKLLADLFEFARVTPFRIPGVLSTTRILLGMGVSSDKMVETLTDLGNVAAGLSVPLEQIALSYGKVAAAGYLTGYELQNLRRAGVPLVRELSKIIGAGREEVQSMVRKRQISFEMFEQAFKNMSKKGGTFHDLMREQAKTLFGIISNIQDGLQIIAIRIGEGLLPQAKKLSNQFLMFLDVNKEIIKLRMVKFLTEVGKFLYRITIELGKNLRSAFKIIDAIIGAERAFKGLLFTLSAIIALKMLSTLGKMAIGINKLANVAFWAQLKMAALPIAIGAAVLLALVAFEDIYKWIKGEKGTTVMEFLDAKYFGGGLRDKILEIWDAFKIGKKWLDASVQDFYGWIADIYNTSVMYIGKIEPLLDALGIMVRGIGTLNPAMIKIGYDRFKSVLNGASEELKEKGVQDISERGKGLVEGAAALALAYGKTSVAAPVLEYLADSVGGSANIGTGSTSRMPGISTTAGNPAWGGFANNRSAQNKAGIPTPEERAAMNSLVNDTTINVSVTAAPENKELAERIATKIEMVFIEHEKNSRRNALKSAGAKTN